MQDADAPVLPYCTDSNGFGEVCDVTPGIGAIAIPIRDVMGSFTDENENRKKPASATYCNTG